MRRDIKKIEGGSLPLAPKVAAPRKRFSATPSTSLRLVGEASVMLLICFISEVLG